MLTVGDRLPALVVTVQRGIKAPPKGKTIDLGQTGGRWRVLFYWPRDFTFVCPTEIVGYGALKEAFAAHGAALIGASTDTAEEHYAWRRSDEQLALADFPWIADSDRALARALGILSGTAQVALRATFIVDPAGIIQHVAVNGFNVGRNPQETLRVLAAIQTGEPCAAGWQEGEPTLPRPA
ncbi:MULTISPECIES: peroxiredoxin [Sphingomonas]|uniref:peroxiredoxin n=1 Tax=Sphingomonas TaxID=13687 RepID=UPI000DEEA92C|nr:MULTISPECIES: peroxiredoxin [Sphingomonas]